MSRSWVERLRIGLAPERVELARLRLVGGAGPAKQVGIACQRRPEQAPWEAALEALDTALPEFSAGGESVTVVLSNHWMRYLVIPWQPAVTGSRELEELARLRFERTFGESATGWVIRCSEGGYGEANVACAVDASLFAALRERLSAHKLKLTSVQPLLMAAYNDRRRDLAASSAFAIVEPGRLCLSLMRDGSWSEIVSRRADNDPAEAIEQEIATLAAEAAPARIDVLLVGEGAVWSADSARPARFLGQSETAACSLALCGTA